MKPSDELLHMINRTIASDSDIDVRPAVEVETKKPSSKKRAKKPSKGKSNELCKVISKEKTRPCNTRSGKPKTAGGFRNMAAIVNLTTSDEDSPPVKRLLRSNLKNWLLSSIEYFR